MTNGGISQMHYTVKDRQQGSSQVPTVWKLRATVLGGYGGNRFYKEMYEHSINQYIIALSKLCDWNMFSSFYSTSKDTVQLKDAFYQRHVTWWMGTVNGKLEVKGRVITTFRCVSRII